MYMVCAWYGVVINGDQYVCHCIFPVYFLCLLFIIYAAIFENTIQSIYYNKPQLKQTTYSIFDDNTGWSKKYSWFSKAEHIGHAQTEFLPLLHVWDLMCETFMFVWCI